MTPNTAHNLLLDPIFTVVLADGARVTRTLPEVLDGLTRAEPAEFAALQAHQFQAWESFLIQLGAIVACARDGALPPDATSWRDALRALTRGDDRPWCLVVDDLTSPAFMQFGLPPGAEAKDEALAPDAIDLLFLSKNHDVKRERSVHARPEHWAVTLVNLQTLQGYGGPHNYGIARMNGGSASRISVGTAQVLGLHGRFARDIQVWLRQRDALVESFGYAPRGGHALLWNEVWDGRAQLRVAALDPFFLEACRRVRLTHRGEGLCARRYLNDATRVQAKELRGVLGDIWVPIDRSKPDEQKALTATGLGYGLLHRVLFDEAIERPAAMEVLRDDGPSCVLLVRLLVRGNCVTDGYHERVLPIPGARVRHALTDAAARAKLGRRSAERVKQVDLVQSKVLTPALACLLQAAPTKLDFQDDRIDRWRAGFKARVDPVFFDALFRDVDVDDTESDRRWLADCVALAREVFAQAVAGVPLPSARALRARASAEILFGRAVRKHCPVLTPTAAPRDEAQPTTPPKEVSP